MNEPDKRQLVYDSRLSSQKDPFYNLPGYSHTIIGVIKVTGEKGVPCDYCKATAPLDCWYTITLIYSKEDCPIILTYCKDCSMQVVMLKPIEEIDWDQHICGGGCNALHLTWAANHPHLAKSTLKRDVE